MTMSKGALLYEEKQQRQANHLCLYCGGLGYMTMNCPHIKNVVHTKILKARYHKNTQLCVKHEWDHLGLE